jgi:peroxiredoxin (alkyl hydroperoxide reductase subunit C)
MYNISIGDEFPAFTLNGVNGNNEMEEFSSEFVLDFDWTVYYFYPKDFTFICPTEIAAMDRLVDEGVNVFGFSGDNEFCKQAWRNALGLIRDIRHPLIADSGLILSHDLGIVEETEGVCLRATYIVDSEGIIQHLSINALDTGRNVEEIIRTVKALQAGGLTGCEWNPGDEFVG